ncbi:MAG: TIGR00366 family protein [Myxococcota bacterium]|nr:TIGR00366 family protein [Myxococcota bacterium]
MSRIPARAATFIRAVTPDPFVLALGLTLVVFVWSWWQGSLGFFDLLDAWAAGPRGFWSLLRFGMQMCMVLVTGLVLARTRPVARAIEVLAQLPRTPAQATVVVALTAMLTALVSWGLGLVVGALLAREVARALERSGRPVQRSALAAAGYSGLVVWHGGLSGSAPLKLTKMEDVVEVLGPELAAQVGTLGLDQTVGHPRNLLVTGAAVLVIVATLAWWTSRSGEESDEVREPPAEAVPIASPGLAGVLETGPWLSAPVALLGLLWVARWVAAGSWRSMDPNVLSFAMLCLGLLVAGSPAAYLRPLGEAARACAGIILQFPFYAGIMGMMVASGLAASLSGALPEDPRLLPLATFLSAGVVNFFVPSGGGQWAVQGPIVVQAALDAGVEVERVVLAMAWGDQWTNLLQPFWALPLLGLTGVRVGALMSYTVVVAGTVGVVFALGTLL